MKKGNRRVAFCVILGHFYFFCGVFGVFYFKKRPIFEKWCNFGVFCDILCVFRGGCRCFVELLPTPRPILWNFGGRGRYPLPLRKNFLFFFLVRAVGGFGGWFFVGNVAEMLDTGGGFVVWCG